MNDRRRPHDELDALFEPGRAARPLDERVRALLSGLRADLRREPPPAVVERHLSAIHSAARQAAHGVHVPLGWRARLGQLLAATTVKVVIASTAAAAATGGLAATGNLPEPVGRVVANVAAQVGVQLPRVNDLAREGPDAEDVEVAVAPGPDDPPDAPPAAPQPLEGLDVKARQQALVTPGRTATPSEDAHEPAELLAETQPAEPSGPTEEPSTATEEPTSEGEAACTPQETSTSEPTSSESPDGEPSPSEAEASPSEEEPTPAPSPTGERGKRKGHVEDEDDDAPAPGPSESGTASPSEEETTSDGGCVTSTSSDGSSPSEEPTPSDEPQPGPSESSTAA